MRKLHKYTFPDLLYLLFPCRFRGRIRFLNGLCSVPSSPHGYRTPHPRLITVTHIHELVDTSPSSGTAGSPGLSPTPWSASLASSPVPCFSPCFTWDFHGRTQARQAQGPERTRARQTQGPGRYSQKWRSLKQNKRGRNVGGIREPHQTHETGQKDR